MDNIYLKLLLQILIENLALPPSWNQMTGIKQWQIEPGTIMLKGIADSQQLQGTQYIYPGGAEQIFIY